MPGTSALKEKVLHEIDRVPEEKLAEVYDLIHHFRVELETTSKQTKTDVQPLMDFAGSWQDLSDTEFTEFLAELQERRQQAFSGRPTRGTGVD